MKVAICLSGHMRTFKICSQSFKDNILIPFIEKGINVDIFIHTWDTTGTYSNRRLFQREIEEIFEEKKIKEYLKDLKMETFSENNFKHINDQIIIPTCGRPNAYGFIGMFYSLYCCNQLRQQYEEQNNIKYDFIIRCRSDLLFFNKININEHLPKSGEITGGFQPNIHTIIKCEKEYDSRYSGKYLNKIKRHLFHENGMMNDQFAIGNNYSMNIYCNVYKDLIKLSSFFQELRPESILLKHLELEKIKTRTLPIFYGMLREDDYIFINDFL